MKQIVFDRYGPPARVVKCVDVAELSAPGPWEVTVEITAAVVNPSDISVLRGQYGVLPPRLPARIGLEAAGKIAVVGEAVTEFAVGDTVILIANDNWCQRRNVVVSQVHKVPEGMDVIQAAMVKTNAISAYLLLTTIVDLQPGDFVIQSAPLSAVGKMVIGMARALGFQTVNIVRRPEAVEEVAGLGGDIAIQDGEDLAERVAKSTHEAPILLGLDAVAGSLTARMVDCLDTGGTLLNYGMLSAEPCHIRADQTIFKDINLRGFWLIKVLGRLPQKERSKVFSDCLDLMARHGLENDVGATYALEDISQAIEFAESPERRGKVLLLPNGPVA